MNISEHVFAVLAIRQTRGSAEFLTQRRIVQFRNIQIMGNTKKTDADTDAGREMKRQKKCVK